MNTYHTSTRWYRDLSNKKISGVCSGLAARLGFPVWSTRLVMIILLIQMPLLIGMGYLVAHCTLPVKGY